MLGKSSFLDLLSSQLVTPGPYVTEKVRRSSSSCHMLLVVFYGVGSIQLLQKHLE